MRFLTVLALAVLMAWCAAAPSTAGGCPREASFGIGGYLGMSGVGASATVGDIAAVGMGQRAVITFHDPTTGAVAAGTGYGPARFDADWAAVASVDAAAGGHLDARTRQAACGTVEPGGGGGR